MKTLFASACGWFCGFAWVSAAPGASPGSRYTEPVKSPWTSAQRTAGQTRWQSVVTLSNVVTRKVSYRTNSFVELGAGLNVPDTKGQFIAANPSFTITPTGAEARGAAHQVFVPGDIGRGEGVKIITPKGGTLVFQPLAVDYFDPVDGRGVLLDTVTNAIGWLVASNEIVFSNCFVHLKASIRLRNTRAGLESDLILHERPPDPEAFGLSSSARLEMLTEQLEGVAPTRRETVLREEKNPAVRADMVEPDFVDTELGFDGMKMAVGKAFFTPTPTNAAADSLRPSRVGKTFLNLEGRNILIEAVEHQKVRGALHKLPLTPNAAKLRAGLAPALPSGRLAGQARSLPALARMVPTAPIRVQQARLSPASDRPASLENQTLLASLPAPAFVLDYYLLSEYGEHDFTFRGDTTYHVSTPLAITGTTTIEGGTVVKFSEGSGLVMFEEDTLVCDTTHYLPAVFTSFDDNSVGEDLGGSGTPGQTATYGFYFISGARTLSNVRFTHLAYPIGMESGGAASEITLRHVQVVDAAYALDTGNTIIKVFNGLFKDCGIVFSGTGTFLGEHLTVHNATALGYASSASVKNSLLVAAQNPSGNISSYTETASANLSSADGVFQTVAGGEHYLPITSPYRGMASTNIDSTLARSLTEMTTHAPLRLSGTNTTNTVLWPVVPRDVATLGYHYPAADYLVKNLTLQNSSLTLRGGVVVAAAFETNANWTSLYLNPGKFISLGTPTRMNVLLRANQIQEGAAVRGDTIVADGTPDQFKPEFTLRFTRVSSLAGESHLLFSGTDFGRFEASHSEFFNGGLYAKLYGGSLQTLALTNNLFQSVNVVVEASSPANFFAYNNTLWRGGFSLGGGHAGWRARFNIFDHTAVTGEMPLNTADENAYVGLSHAFEEDSYVESSSLGYASGPLGKFYLPGTALQNLGTASASALGLYHFTTRTNQTKEGGSAVDYGFHYVAVTNAANGELRPLDQDRDGLADYTEDANGNGTADSGETDFRLRLTDGEQNDRLVTDHAAPRIFITSPAQLVTARTRINLDGFCDEPVSRISYTLFTNGAASASGSGYVRTQAYDRDTRRYTTNFFRCHDLRLAPGLNTIVLQAVDWHSNTNTITVNYTVNFSVETNAPVLTPAWPTNGLAMSGAFTMSGTLDNPSSTVLVTVASASGTNRFPGHASLDGQYWIPGVTLDPGTNTVTTVVTSAAGHARSKTIELTRSPVALTIQPDSYGIPALFDDRPGRITGTISTNTVTSIFVNGVPGSLVATDFFNPNLVLWAVENVPGDDNSWLDLHATAQLADGSWVGSTLELEKPPVLRLKDYHLDWTNWENQWQTDCGYQAGGHGLISLHTDLNCVTTWDWTPAQVVENYRKVCSDGLHPGPWAATMPSVLQEISDLHQTVVEGTNVWTNDRLEDGQVELRVGGRPYPGRRDLLKFTGWAQERTYGFDNDAPIPFYAVNVGLPSPNGVSLGALGGLDTNGTLYALAEPNARLDVTPKVPGPDAATGVEVVQSPLVILRGGQPITWKTTKVVVGENINLVVTSSLAFSNVQWRIEGSPIKLAPFDLDPLLMSTGCVVYLTNSDLTNSSVTFFYNEDHDKELKVTCTAMHNGIAFSTVEATLKIIRPTANFEVTVLSQVTVDTNTPSQNAPAGWYLRFGSSKSNETQGIVFRFNGADLKGYKGDFYFMVSQTGHSQGTEKRASGITNWVANGLDGTPLSYFPPWNRTNDIGGSSFNDSPAELLKDDEVEVSRTSTYQTYLMFNPREGHEIPIRVSTWTWGGTATNSGTAWHLVPPATEPANFNSVLTKQYPCWTDRLSHRISTP